MQRLFSTFPGGLPGLGLLLLRCAVGVSLVVQGFLYLLHAGSWLTWIGAALAITGVSLSAGMLTPVACILAQMISIAIALSYLPLTMFAVSDGRPATLFLFVMAVALLLMGPGAFSLDARWFQRREVVIPHGALSLKE